MTGQIPIAKVRLLYRIRGFARACKDLAMRRAALVPALLCILLGGCTESKPIRSTSLFDRLRTPVMGPDIVQIDVALLELPLGDSFINKELWNYTDEQLVALEQKANLDDNGFRVGQIVGMPPDQLQKLLTSPRSCSNPRRRLLPSGRSVEQVLGPPLPHVEFQVKQNGQTINTNLDQAQFALEVVPTLTNDGKTKLRFTPKILYGENVPNLRPAEDGSDWSFQVAKLNKNYSALAWEVSLAPSEFLVIGTIFEQPLSLGYHAFVQEDGKQSIQRLLVLRTNRSPNNNATMEELARTGRTLPLAEQATVSAIRARGQ